MPNTPSTNLRFYADQDDEPEWLSAEELYRSIRTRRAIAFIIDAVILAVAGVLLWLFGSAIVVVTLGGALPLLILAAALLPLAYHTFTISSDAHATFGMQIMGIRVVRWDGEGPGMLQAAVHTILFYLSIGITNLLILLLSLLNERGRCLHDYLSGCVVINDIPVVAYEIGDKGDTHSPVTRRTD